MYCEDVDWCYRIHKAGMKIMYVPQASITHAIGRKHRPGGQEDAPCVSTPRMLRFCTA